MGLGLCGQGVGRWGGLDHKEGTLNFLLSRKLLGWRERVLRLEGPDPVHLSKISVRRG